MYELTKCICSNEQYIYIVKNINRKNPQYYLNHGRNHLQNVARICKNISKSLKYTEEEMELIELIAYIHDLGCIYGKDNHNLNGKQIVENILSNYNIEEYKKNIILTSILEHSYKDISNKFSAVLVLADKLHLNYKRLLKKGYSNLEHSEIEKIKDIKYTIINNNIYINFVTSSKLSKYFFEKFHRTIGLTYCASKYLNLNPIYLVNNKILKVKKILIKYGYYVDK